MNQPDNDLENLHSIEDVDQLEELLSRPTPEVIESLSRPDGDLIVLGACGKIGPSLARMARRAIEATGVPGVRSAQKANSSPTPTSNTSQFSRTIRIGRSPRTRTCLS